MHHIHAIERASFASRSGACLQRQGIQSAIHYPEPIHLMAPYRDPAIPLGSLPQAARVASGILSLPVYPVLAEASVEQVASAVRASLAARV